MPTYRHEALPEYQSGREFERVDPRAARRAARARRVVRLPASGRRGGYEADDFLAAAARVWKGPVVVATSDRDAFQLVSDRVTILQPVKGVSELARIGPAEVRERYGVEPEQVLDFIALRGDPSDRIPGAPGVGPKKAATSSRSTARSTQALAAGRFSHDADDLRLYRDIATMDADAPLPKLEPTPPDWASAAEHARELGLGALAKRLASAPDRRIEPSRSESRMPGQATRKSSVAAALNAPANASVARAPIAAATNPSARSPRASRHRRQPVEARRRGRAARAGRAVHHRPPDRLADARCRPRRRSRARPASRRSVRGRSRRSRRRDGPADVHHQHEASRQAALPVGDEPTRPPTARAE